MVPERQRIEDEWNLVYSLEQDGASLATLYKMCSGYEQSRTSFVLVVKDNEGGVSTLLFLVLHAGNHFCSPQTTITTKTDKIPNS